MYLHAELRFKKGYERATVCYILWQCKYNQKKKKNQKENGQ